MTRTAPLRDDAYEAVLARVVRGALAPGARINESRLAAELGVSRTPLREALFRLEREGFVRSHLARGFFVAPLTGREARETYPVLWTLEVLALRESGDAASLVVAELELHNAALASAASPDAAREADAAWHATLLSRCPNRRLLGMIRDLRRTVERYERIFMTDPALVRVSVRQHAEVQAALASGQVEAAAPVLAENWRYGMHALLLKLPD